MDEIRERLQQALEDGDPERGARAAEVLAAYLRADASAEQILRNTAQELLASAGIEVAHFSLHKVAEMVLEDAGVPLHVRELGKRIKALGWKHRRPVSREDQINYQLAARLPRHPDTFVRVAPNTFALVRWGRSRARKATPKPRVGLFRGPGGRVGASLGDKAHEVAESEWRSS